MWPEIHSFSSFRLIVSYFVEIVWHFWVNVPCTLKHICCLVEYIVLQMSNRSREWLLFVSSLIFLRSSINCWETGVKVFNYNCGFFWVVLLFCQFLFIYFEALILRTFMFLSFWLIDPFICMKFQIHISFSLLVHWTLHYIVFYFSLFLLSVSYFSSCSCISVSPRFSAGWLWCVWVWFPLYLSCLLFTWHSLISM